MFFSNLYKDSLFQILLFTFQESFLGDSNHTIFLSHSQDRRYKKTFYQRDEGESAVLFTWGRGRVL